MRLLLALVCVWMLAAPAAALPIVLSGPMTGAAFWNNSGYDANATMPRGPYANIGTYLTGTPGVDPFFTNAPGLPSLAWLGDGSTTFRWDGVPEWRLLHGITAWTDWFSVSPSGVFTLATPYDTWASDTLDGGRSHFALFSSGSTYYLGIEDMTWGQRSDWDYQDVIVEIKGTPVPDAGSTLVLLGLGLIALSRLRR